MRVSLKSFLAGGAVILAAAAVTPALAQQGQVHVLNVQLPGGGVEHIQYTGNVPPRVILMPAPALAATPVILTPTFAARRFSERSFAADPFVMLERISAMMDQQAASMLRQADAIPALPSMSGNGVCMRSLRITFNGNAAPKEVSSTSGDCGPGHGRRTPADVNMPSPAPRPNAVPSTIEARASTSEPVQQIALNR